MRVAQQIHDLMEWLNRHWVVGAGFMAAALLAAAPAVGHAMPVALFLLYLHSPAYMIHQVEEHTDERFLEFANARVFHGREVMRTGEILVINLPLVWGVNLAALYAGEIWGAGWGLVAPYAMMVNAALHLAAARHFRCTNPGLITAAALFLPLGLGTAIVIGLIPGVSVWQHALGLGLALALHGAIAAHAVSRDRWLRAHGW
jgi:hypothetical protein